MGHFPFHLERADFQLARPNPKGVVSSSPGLPPRLPWETMNANVSNPNGVVSTFVGWNAHYELTQPRWG